MSLIYIYFIFNTEIIIINSESIMCTTILKVIVVNHFGDYLILCPNDTDNCIISENC